MITEKGIGCETDGKPLGGFVDGLKDEKAM